MGCRTRKPPNNLEYKIVWAANRKERDGFRLVSEEGVG
jgi:hypothetical protein